MQKTRKLIKKKQKGIIFSLEAGIALLAFGLILATLPTTRPVQNEELLALEQANDLLRIWSYANETDATLSTDTRECFGDRAELWINDNRVLRANTTLKNTISTEGIILDNTLNEKKIRIVVYHN